MKLNKPFVGYFAIGQKFGENFNSYYKAQGLLGHQGIDIPMPNGTPIISAVNGTVIGKSIEIQKGEGVAIMSLDIFQYKGQDCLLDTIYWHMQDGSIKVNVGDKVTIGQPLGLSNNTGMTTGPHLHFAVIPMATDGSRKALESYSNGYHACVDPLPYLDWTFHRLLRRGDRGEDVKELQTRLNMKGYTLVVDGIFGKLTQVAVMDFQSKNGLLADGIVGPLTRNKLNL